MEIFCGLLLIIILILCFVLQKVQHSRELDLNKQEHELEALNKEILKAQEKIKSSEEEYQKRKTYIEDVKQIAQREYQEQKLLLEMKYQNAEDLLEAKFLEKKKNLQEEEERIILETDSIKQELEKFLNTKAATVAAFQREEKIKQEKDNYRVVFNQSEEDDIKTLYDIRYRLNNKRILDMLIWQTFVRDKLKQILIFVFPEKDMCGIYKITNLKNDKCYIGQAKKLQDRITQHFKHALYIDCPQGNKLYEAMQQDGIENFTVELLEECEPEFLDEKERYYIKLYNTVDWGYNKIF